jgi:predicted nucleic acid-binding protein
MVLAMMVDALDDVAALFNAAGRKRGTFVDCLIASVAIDDDARLATTNPKDFKGMAGLRLVDGA